MSHGTNYRLSKCAKIHRYIFISSTNKELLVPKQVLKTRLALATTGQYGGMADCLRQIVRNEGVTGLYRGLTPSLVGIVPYAGIDLAVYEVRARAGGGCSFCACVIPRTPTDLEELLVGSSQRR